MNDKQACPPVTSEDAAWATINTPLEASELKVFCQDIERLFRINPMLHFKQWRALGMHRYHFSGQNISQQAPFDFDLIVSVKQLPDGIQMDYSQGLKTRTTFVIEPITSESEWRSKLTITDSYDGEPEQVRKQQLHLVDKSITIWATYLQQYLQSWKQWSHFAPWRWYMRTVWQPMKPAGRRITNILLFIAGFEVVLILLGVAIYYLEYSS